MSASRGIHSPQETGQRTGSRGQTASRERVRVRIRVGVGVRFRLAGSDRLVVLTLDPQHRGVAATAGLATLVLQMLGESLPIRVRVRHSY